MDQWYSQGLRLDSAARRVLVWAGWLGQKYLKEVQKIVGARN